MSSMGPFGTAPLAEKEVAVLLVTVQPIVGLRVQKEIFLVSTSLPHFGFGQTTAFFSATI